jgi:predicted short-subunit dehydrogenase-like oxidoreductase (DUF2520 family)
VSERIVIIGTGRMGLALGAALRASGIVERLIFHGRAHEPPPHPVFDAGPAGEEPAEYRVGGVPLPAATTVLLLAVPDDALAEVVWGTARLGSAPAGCVALHLSGSLSTDVLAPLHEAGYAVGSLHPLQTAADPRSGAARLSGSWFAVAGEPAAMRRAMTLVDALGGTALVVPPALRPVYHAAAVFASNYLVVLAAVAARVMAHTGVGEADGLAALVPLMRGTLDNIERLGPADALTGPIARGDADTVRLHLRRLSPADRPLYCALGLEALGLARARGLDERRAHAIESLLTAS